MDGIEQLRFERQLEQHLDYNFYPPVDRIFFPACLIAIFACVNENFNKTIDLPNGKKTTAKEFCDEMHLWYFVGFAMS